MGDDIGSGLVTNCRLRSDSDPLSSTNLPYGENQNKPFYRFQCHHPLITQLRNSHAQDLYTMTLVLSSRSKQCMIALHKFKLLQDRVTQDTELLHHDDIY